MTSANTGAMLYQLSYEATQSENSIRDRTLVVDLY